MAWILSAKGYLFNFSQKRRFSLLQVNSRKEFFRVTLAEISKAVKEFHGEIEFTLLAEAVEYRKTLAFLQEKGEIDQPIINEVRNLQ